MQRIFLFLLLAGTVSACTKDDTQSAEDPQNNLVLTLDAGTSDFESDEATAATSEYDTRAGYDGIKSIWHANDEIGLSFDAVNTNLHFTQVAGSLSTDSRRVSYNGTLNSPLSGTVSAVAYYPYSATASVSGKTVTTTFPATQTYNAAGGYRGLPLFSSFTGNYNNIRLAFKNLYSVVKLNLVKGVALTNTIKLQRIVFSGNNNETVSGAMTVNMSGATPVVNFTGTGKTITLDMTGSNVELTSAGQALYIAIPAINYSKGYSFTIVTDNGQVTKSAKNTGATYVANKIYTTPPLTINSLSLVTIPDANLRAALQALGLISVFDNLLGTVSITSAGLTAQSIDISGKGIADLTGLDKFPALLTLNAGNNNLVSADLSKLTLLTNLDLSKNQLTSLNLAANTALTSLNLSSNKLTSLNLATNLALLSLDVSANNLTSLDLHNNILLTTLKLHGNPFVTLNISGLKALLSMHLVNGIESVNTVTKTLTIPTAATIQNLITDGVALTNWVNLVCSNNQNILSISVKNNTGLLSVTATGNNNLTSLDVSGNATLTNLAASGNALTTLNLASSLALLSLDVSSNQLTSLDLHNNILLTTLKVYGNPLVTLNISGLKALLSLNLANGVESVNTLTKTLTIPATAVVQNLITDGVALTNWLNLVCNSNPNILSISAKNNTGMLSVTATGNSKLASLDVSGNLTLTNVTANGNVLTTLNLTGSTGLLTLNAASNKLATINLAGQTAMTSVDVSTNLLTSLDLHNNILLTSVKCFGNALDTLNISGLVALLNLYLDTTNTSAISLLKFTVPTGATVKNLIANNASAAVNWTSFDCTGNPTIASISLQNNTLLTSVTAKNNPQLLTLNVKGCLITLIVSTSGNKTGFAVTGPL